MEASRKVWSEKAVPKRKKEPEKTKKLSGPLGDFSDFYDNMDSVSECSGFTTESRVTQAAEAPDISGLDSDSVASRSDTPASGGDWNDLPSLDSVASRSDAPASKSS